jgi:hypothetical protein
MVTASTLQRALRLSRTPVRRFRSELELQSTGRSRSGRGSHRPGARNRSQDGDRLSCAVVDLFSK